MERKGFMSGTIRFGILVFSLVWSVSGLEIKPPAFAIISPTVGTIWHKGSVYQITWTGFGSVIPRVKFSLRNGPASATIVNLSIFGSANDGNRNWRVPETVPVGSYQIRISDLSDQVLADSAVFTIAEQIDHTTPMANPGGLQSMCDLELKRVSYTTEMGGRIVARIRSNINAIDQDVKFQVIFPEMTRGGLFEYTRHIQLDANTERDFEVRPMPPQDIPISGALTRVIIDSDHLIAEANEGNNSFETRIAILDISCNLPRSELYLAKLPMAGDIDLKVIFGLRARHNLSQTVRGIKVRWEIRNPAGGCVLTRTYTIHELASGQVWEHTVVELFGRADFTNASDVVNLRLGTTYDIVFSVFDPENVMFDVNPRNDLDRLSFSFPE